MISSSVERVIDEWNIKIKHHEIDEIEMVIR